MINIICIYIYVINIVYIYIYFILIHILTLYLTFCLTFFLALCLAFSLVCVRVQAWPTASGDGRGDPHLAGGKKSHGFGGTPILGHIYRIHI